MHPNAWKKLAGTETSAGSGRYVLEGNEFLGHRILRSNQMTNSVSSSTASMLFGRFDDLIIGEWGAAPTLIVDPYSNSLTGAVRVVLHQFVDIAPRHAESFSYGENIDVS